jgi:parvulin-like peptidyl-prolyl isomerase
MTSRPRSTTHSRTWDDRERRATLLNVGFGLVIVAALLLLLIAWGVSWYNDHLSAAGTVNGQTITKDAWGKQVAINQFRADYQKRRIRTLLAAGQISAADAESRNAFIDERLQQLDPLSLEQLVDGTIQAELAASQGVTVTPADIDAQFKEEATTPELRRAWMIEVAPELAGGASKPTDQAVAAARAKADQAVADLKAGKDWETIAKSVSTDPSKEQAGDLGFIDKDSTLDPAFLAGLLAAAKDTPTGVVEGEDGSFRIGRVTEIVAPVEDATLAAQVSDAGINLDDFRAALGRDVTRSKLSDAILAGRLAAGPQRDVSEIFMQAGSSETGPSAIRVRHILYSPNDTPRPTTPLPDTDPAWAKAELEAKATWEKLKTDPSQFDTIARAESDEGQAVTTGGKLPYFSTDDQLAQGFADAIFKPGLQPGQLLDPVKTEFGWHVIQVMHGPTDAEWADKLAAEIGAGSLPFADAARDNSDNAEAAQGGAVGWIGKGQVDEAKEAAIFAAPVGKVSEPYVVPDEGIYLFLVGKEETREPDAKQRTALAGSAFPLWYSQQKAGFDITRDSAISGEAS